jgi:hypothetical protein
MSEKDLIKAGDFTWDEREAAPLMELRSYPISAEATAFVEKLLQDVILPAWPADLQQRKTTVEKHRKAIGALMADLLRLRLRNGVPIGKRGMADKDFTGLPFGHDVFRRTREALIGADLLEFLGGYRYLTAHVAKGTVSSSVQACFRLTGRALALADGAGLLVDSLPDWLEHWDRPRATVAKAKGGAALIVLKSQKIGYGPNRTEGKPLAVDNQADRVRSMVQELEEHNAFIEAAGVDGSTFSGLRRIFNNGDVEGFAWQWGGRMFSVSGGGYEGDRKDDRFAIMRLGGQRIGEVDLKASHLSILYALRGVQFDAAVMDPYAVGGIDREIVKAWITHAVGRGDTKATRWSAKARDTYKAIAPDRNLQADYPFTQARDAILTAHPVLGELEGDHKVSVLSLMYHESVLAAMRSLRLKGIPSLPVHDCVIAPVGSLPVAQRVLMEAFSAYLQSVTGTPSVVKPATHLQWPGDIQTPVVSEY